MESLQQHESPKEYETWMDANRVLAAILDIGELCSKAALKLCVLRIRSPGFVRAYGFLRSDVFTITSEHSSHSADGRRASDDSDPPCPDTADGSRSRRKS